MAASDAVIPEPWTGDYRVDALIAGPNFRWNYDPALPQSWGQSSTISFSFMQAPPSYASLKDQNGFKAFSQAQRSQVREIFNALSLFLDIDFAEVEETETNWGQIRFGNNNQDEEQTAGYAYLPQMEEVSEASGDVYIAVGHDLDYQKGDTDRETLLHEIGHALGLKHPSPPALSSDLAPPQNYLGMSEDTSRFTIMSYEAHPQALSRADYGIYDIVALRKLYGSRPYHSDDDFYMLDRLSGNYQSALLDDGGNDLVDLSLISNGVKFSLEPGRFSSVGKTLAGKAAIDNFSIALDSFIERVIATNHSDRIDGNKLDNWIAPLSGYDTIDAGAGVDTIAYRNERSAYRIDVGDRNNAENNMRVQAISHGVTTAPELKLDELTNVERLVFKDVGLAFDLEANAGLAVKVLHLIFGNKGFSPEMSGLALRYVDTIGIDQSANKQTAVDALLNLDLFWLNTEDRSDRSLVSVLLQRIWEKDPEDIDFSEQIDSLVPLISSLGGQAAFMLTLIEYPDFESKIGFSNYADTGLIWI